MCGASALACLALSSCVGPGLGEPATTPLRTGWSVQAFGGLTGSVYLPASSGTIGDGRALLVTLHGCAQSYADLENYGNWVDTAEDYGMVVSLPGVAGGGVYFGCWDYYGGSHSRALGDAADLLDHVESLVADPTLGIDPNQVYIAGLSSGGGMAMVMACLAPDVFAGVGIAAGPTIGTSSFEISSVSTNRAAAVATCESLAGTHAGDFGTQLGAMISGTMDFTVAPGYADLNAEVFAELYAQEAGADLTPSPIDDAVLPGYEVVAEGTRYEDAEGSRVLRISVVGMGHAWPAGSGPGPEIGFVATEGVDFARVLAETFTENNRRVTVGGSGGGGGTGGSTTDGGTTSGGTTDGGSSDDGGTTDGGTTDGGSTDGSTTDGGSTGGGSTGDLPCEPWVDVATATMSGHFSRFGIYPGGYGVADTTYLELFFTYGSTTPFDLYQAASGDWYHDPANVPGDCP